MRLMGFFCIIILVLLYFDTNRYIDVSKYQQTYKTIEIKGEVKNPGVYDVAWDATTAMIIKKAGGLNKDADTSQLNLTQNLEHRAVLVIGRNKQQELISINSASLEDLDALKGVGPSIAQRILDYRKVHPFQSLEELKEVKGIGDKLFEKIRNDICL